MTTDAGNEPDLDRLLALAVRAATAAGAELLRRYGTVEGLDTKSSATDPVSDADRAAESLITDILLGERPQDGILGEEGADRPSSSGLVWVVDPLDGTVNYLYELDNFAVSIGAQDAEGGLLGVVHDPVGGRTFTAVRGRGAFLGDRRLRVNDPVPAARALVTTGFGYTVERRRRQVAVISELLPKIRDIRRIGSAALDLCAVAAGQADAFWEEGVQAWDVAAGHVIAREAGAVVSPTRLTDAPSGWLVAGPALHGELAGVLAEIGINLGVGAGGIAGAGDSAGAGAEAGASSGVGASTGAGLEAEASSGVGATAP